MAYINTITKEYPISQQDIRSLYPNTSFPAIFKAPQEFSFVFPAPVPSYDAITQYYIEAAPKLSVQDKWEQQWEVVDLSVEQIAINDLEHRNQIKTSIEQQTQQRLDDFAKTRNYDGIMSCCTYATSPNTKFSSEAAYCVEARDATWTTIYQILADVENNVRPLPTSYAEIESELPVLQWTA